MKHLKSKAVLLLLCYTLLGIAVPAYAQDYKHWVAGTEFETNKSNRAQYPFYLTEYGKEGTTNCDDLQFYNGDVFPQKIIVADNQKYKAARTILYTGRSYDVREFGYNRANSTPGNMYNLDYNEYIVTTPGSLAGKTVGGLEVSQDSRVVNSGMFITKTANKENVGDKVTECLFHYRVDGLTLTEKSNFQLAIGFVNLSTATGGDLSFGLTYDIYGVIKEANGNEKIEYIYAKGDGLWSLNSGESKELTESRSREFGVESKYSSIIVTIYIANVEQRHIAGIDYINIYSEQNIVDVPEAPVADTYSKCATVGENPKPYASLFAADVQANGTFAFYEDPDKTTPWPTTTFDPNTERSETIYYTYTDNATSTESKVGTLTVTVYKNPVITLTTDMPASLVKCNTKDWKVSAWAKATPASNIEMKWTLGDYSKGVTISPTSKDNTIPEATATVTFHNGTGQIYTDIDAIFTATATTTAGSCSASLSATPINLTNNDCTDIDIDNEASADLNPTTNEVCVGDNVTYVFTLTNSSGATSEKINVSVEIPTELLNVTVTADALGSYKNGVWTVPTMKTTDKPTLTIKGKS
ncbi:MAG: hypothetical protein UFP03_03540, partial [Paludibacteraceae bacterium]|nr:hypothetical protein [Paludibacteraceae bacterium]